MNTQKLFLQVRESEVLNAERIKTVEDYYTATYVGDFCVKDKSGGWANQPVAIFYQENPPAQSPLGNPCSNYLGLYYFDGRLHITDGQSAFSEPIYGAVAQNGEVIYSSYRHHFNKSTDGTAIIDGARSYLKTNGCKTVTLKVVKDKLIILDEG